MGCPLVLFATDKKCRQEVSNVGDSRKMQESGKVLVLCIMLITHVLQENCAIHIRIL